MNQPGSMVRIGVFGGAFDPPHNAHVALAAAAMAQLDLKELRIFPTGQAWHKARALTSAEDRLAMTRLAFQGLPGAVIDTREVLRPGPTYTLETLRELHDDFPGVQWVLVMGEDQARALPSWNGWQGILSLAIVSVAHRAIQTGDAVRFDPSALPGLPAGARFETLELPAMDISATDIRERAALGEDLSALVPPAVARYIDQHLLYRPA